MTIKPEVGMGATLYYTGQYFPATITRVTEVNGEVTEVYIREDTVLNEETGGVNGTSDYEFVPSPDFVEELFTLDSNGRFVSDYGMILIGKRSYLVASWDEGGASELRDS